MGEWKDWIPVSERLPEQGVNVLVWLADRRGKMFIASIGTSGVWCSTDRYCPAYHASDDESPTHWMPLPAPPDDLRGRLVCAVRDERLPESVRRLLVCLLHGQGIEHATQEGFQRQGHLEEHQDAEAGGEAHQTSGRDRAGEGGEDEAEVNGTTARIDYDPASIPLRLAGITEPCDRVEVRIFPALFVDCDPDQALTPTPGEV